MCSLSHSYVWRQCTTKIHESFLLCCSTHLFLFLSTAVPKNVLFCAKLRALLILIHPLGTLRGTFVCVLILSIIFTLFHSPSPTLDVAQTRDHKTVGSFSPLPNIRCVPFIFISGMFLQLFLPSSTPVELCLPTLLGALNSASL